MLRLVYRPPADEDEAARRRVKPRRLVVPAVAVVLVSAAVGVFVGTGGATTAAPARGGCNGHAELCDRPLADVALAATHNSMSVPLPGWYSADAGGADRRPAPRRHPRPADRHALRRPPPQRPAAHVLRQPGPADPGGPAGRREPRGRRRRDPPAQPPRLRGQGRARHVPVPHVLRARGDLARVRPEGPAQVPGRQPGRGPRDHQPGLRDAGGLREGGRRRRPRGPRLPGPDRPLADAAGDDRLGPAGRVPRREPRGRGAVVPPRVRADHRGDAVRLLTARAAHAAGRTSRSRAGPTAARRARRCSSSTTGSRPIRCRCRPTPRR